MQTQEYKEYIKSDVWKEKCEQRLEIVSCCRSEKFSEYAKRHFRDKIKEKSLIGVLTSL